MVLRGDWGIVRAWPRWVAEELIVSYLNMGLFSDSTLLAMIADAKAKAVCDENDYDVQRDAALKVKEWSAEARIRGLQVTGGEG